MKKKYVILIVVIAFMVLVAAGTTMYKLLPNTVYSLFPSLFNNVSFPVTVNNSDESDKEITNVGKVESYQVEPVSYQTYLHSANENVSEEQIIEMDMQRLEGLYKHLNKYYLWDIDYNAVYDAMATAMFETLGDKYSYYVKSDEAENYHEETTGKYGGLGFYFSKTYVSYQDPAKEETLYCNISQVFPNTPAARGGLQSGDMITHIDGQDVTALEANDCSKIMKGDIGSEVTITIKRNNRNFDITMKREMITVPTVEYTMLDNGIAYMLILKFSPDTVTKVGKVLTELKKQGMKSLIIDLRDNPGGDVDVTLNIANYFVSDKDLLTVNYKDKSKNKTYHATKNCLVGDDVKVVVLINGGTASSAEILSASLRDNGRATLVGSKSFGKGIMQVIASYQDGYASVTTASLITPAGFEYHKLGIEPDIEVKSVIVEEDEREKFNKLVEDKVAEKFIESNPEYSIKNVNEFVRQNKDCGLREELLQILIRNQYYLKMNYDDRPKVDLWFDPQIKKAVEILSK